MSTRPLRLAALWFADLAGYTELSSRDEDRAVAAVERLQEAANAVVPAHGGRIVKFLGDAVLADFPSTAAAARAAIELRQRFASGGEAALRIGLHVGEVVSAADGDLYGEGVNLAARIQEAAEAGEIWASEDAWRQLRRRPEFRLEPRGARALKGVSAPVEIYALAVGAPGEGPAAQATPPSDKRPSIAVLPFTNMSASPENEYFSDGVTEEILTTLARLGGLKVISRTSVMQYKQTRKPVRQIAAELGVGTILEGSVRQAGERVRITAQLIDARTDEHLWAERYDRQLDDIFQIQSDVAGRIVEALRVRLTPRELARIEKPPTDSVEAYEWYLKARFQVARRTGEAVRKAQAALEKAVTIDPTFARAWAALATTWALLPGYGGTPIEEAAPRVREAAEQAHALDPSLGEPHAALGLTAMNEWEWEECGRELARAIELTPSWATAHQWYGNYLMLQGRPEEAIAALRRALELDPLSLPLHMTLGGAYYFAQRFEEALQVHRTALELDPEYVPEHVNLAGVLMQVGRIDEGIAAMETAARLAPQEISPEWVAEFRAGFEAGGKQGFREAYVEGLRSRPGLWARRFNMAAGLADLGRHDEAIAILEELVAEHDPMAIQIGVQPSFDVLRGEPRFQALLQRVGLAGAVRSE